MRDLVIINPAHLESPDAVRRALPDNGLLRGVPS